MKLKRIRKQDVRDFMKIGIPIRYVSVRDEFSKPLAVEPLPDDWVEVALTKMGKIRDYFYVRVE